MRSMLTAVARGRTISSEYVMIACAAPAKAFGLWLRKGVLEVGSDADIAIVDMARKERIQHARLHSIGNATPFEGRATTGVPLRTLVRGRTVALEGKPVGYFRLGPHRRIAIVNRRLRCSPSDRKLCRGRQPRTRHLAGWGRLPVSLWGETKRGGAT